MFLCMDEFAVGFFVQMNNTGGPVDVWVVTGIDPRHLIESGTGFSNYPAKIPPSQIALTERPAGDAGLGPGRAQARRRRKKSSRSPH